MPSRCAPRCSTSFDLWLMREAAPEKCALQHSLQNKLQTETLPPLVVGRRRDVDSARVLMDDLAGRVTNSIQLTTDALRVYLDAVGETFSNDIDYGMLGKVYGASPGSAIGGY